MDRTNQISSLAIAAALRVSRLNVGDIDLGAAPSPRAVDSLAGPGAWLDADLWDKVAKAICEAAGRDGELFFWAGQRSSEFGLLGSIEFLPWFLSTPVLFLRNFQVFQSRLDRIMQLAPEYITESRCRFKWRLLGERRPPRHYLEFLKGLLTFSLGLWKTTLERIEDFWDEAGRCWVLVMEWQPVEVSYQRALEELFVEPKFFEAVVDGLERIEESRSERLNELLEANRQLRGLSPTRRSQAEALESAPDPVQERYRQLFTRLQDGVFRITFDGRMVDANPAALKLFGFSSVDELRSRRVSIKEFFNESERFRLARVIASFRRDGFLKDYEVRLRRADGSQLELMVSAFPGRDPETNEDLIEGVLHDETDKRRMQKALAQTSRFLEAIFFNNPTGLQVIDADGWTVSLNPQMEMMFGFRAEDIIGKGRYNILRDDGLQEAGIIELLGQARRGKISQLNSLRLKPGGDSPFRSYLKAPLFLSVTAYPLPHEANTANHVVISYTDITESYLLTQQINQLQKLQTINTLASGIAHDFNNILGAIVPNADLIMINAGSNDLIERKARAIKTAAKRAATLTSQLTSFARESRGDFRPVNIRNSIAEAVELISNAVPKNVHIEVEPCGELPLVPADALQVQQVLINLIINARDAIADSGVITISSGTYELRERMSFGGNILEPGLYVYFAVADQGVGIPPEVMAQVFDPFFTTKDKGRGTGLGLSVVFGIVKNHNGLIRIDSKVSEGTRFEVYFPAMSRHGGAKK